MARTERKDGSTGRFHGRVEANGRVCAAPGCDEPGEFRAPAQDDARPHGDGPAHFRWMCLEHVRAFNARYNFFSGMTPDEIYDAQKPYAGWESETRAFAASGADRPPRWADFHDPMDAIGARFRERMRAREPREDGRPLSGRDREALSTLGLGSDADRRALRQRYADLVRRFHPDRNGGDRSHEGRLQEVIAAYQHLRAAPAFV